MYMYFKDILFLIVAQFEPFLKAYVDKFKYQSIDSNQWKQFLLSFFQSKVIKNLLFM